MISNQNCFDGEWNALIPGGGGGEGTLNVEVIGMLVGIFLENPKKYPDFDFKPLKNT